MFMTTIERWMVDGNGIEHFGKDTRYFETKEERDWFRAKYTMGSLPTSNMKVIREAYEESLEDFG